MDLKNLIQNVEYKEVYGFAKKKVVSSSDLVYLPDLDYEISRTSARIVTPSDFARDEIGPKELKDPMFSTDTYWLKNRGSGKKALSISLLSENPVDIDVKNSLIGIRPCITLDAKLGINVTNINHYINFNISVSNDVAILEFGEYPQDKEVDPNKVNGILNMLKNNNPLQYTGRNFSVKKGVNSVPYKEFIYNSQKYVMKKIGDIDGVFNFYKVQPLVWEILNWSDLPKGLNPNGSEKDKEIKLFCTTLIGFSSFYPENHKNCNLYAKSSVRAFINGINVNEDKFCGGNFRRCGNFVDEAFGIVDIQKKEIKKDTDEKKQENKASRVTRIDILNPNKNKNKSKRIFTYTEHIKHWVDNGESVLLRGPSGIGKTDRLKSLYPDLIYLKLTNNMFPEKVVGSVNLQTGQNIPPDFAKQAIMNCATEEERQKIQENIQNLYDLADEIYERSKQSNKKTVILLDELLNVRPAIQSLVYTLVLNKVVETGKGLKLPANTVVVATGNQKKYSSVAEDLAEPLEKRFDHILDMEPKVGEWLSEYAIPHKLHPVVLSYIFSNYYRKSKSEKLEDIGYFYEEPIVGEKNPDKFGCKGKTNDPRGWESISNNLYAFEADLKRGEFGDADIENILKVSLESKLRREWADDFFDFYNNPSVTVQEVLDNSYKEEDLPQTINEKFACLAGLLGANEKQVKACRDFIDEYCGKEFLSIYDLFWAGDDPNRMTKILDIENFKEVGDDGKNE